MEGRDIARLVLGYLQDQNLEKASKAFYKTSPHLQAEGVRMIPLNCCNLSDMIREYCNIKSKVSQFIEALPREVKERFEHHSGLEAKIETLLDKFEDDVLGKNPGETSTLKRRHCQLDCDFPFPGATRVQGLPGYSSNSYPWKRRRLCVPTATNDQSFMTTSDSELDTTTAQKCTNPKDFPRRRNAFNKSVGAQSKENSEDVSNLNRNQSKTSETSLQNSSLEVSNAKINVRLPECSPNVNDSQNEAIQTPDVAEKTVQASTNEDSIKQRLRPAKTPIWQKMKAAPKGKKGKAAAAKKLEEAETQSVDLNIEGTSSTIQVPPPPIVDETTTEATTLMSPLIAPQAITKPSSNVQILSNDVISITSAQQNPQQMESNYAISKILILPSDVALNNSSLVKDDGMAGCSSGFEQLIFDTATGHMTIPVIMSNDGSFNFPLLINGEFAQTVSNQEPLVIEPQRMDLPMQDTITIPAELIEEYRNSMQTEKVVKSPEKAISNGDTSPGKSQTMPAALESHSDKHKGTPESSVINSIVTKCLSTPRRRTSHVRVLNFTTPLRISPQPKGGAEAAEDVGTSNVATSNSVVMETDVDTKEVKEPLAQQEKESNHAITEIPVHSDCSNSNSVGFAGEKLDQTVIQNEISDTPKRKTDVASCIRVISRSASEEGERLESPKTKKQKSAKKSPKKSTVSDRSSKKQKNKEPKSPRTEENPSPVDPMKEWQQMRSITNNNLDNHLRELHSQLPVKTSRFSTRKKRRRIGGTPKKPYLKDSLEITEEDSIEAKSSLAKKSSPPKIPLLNFRIVTPLKSQKSAKKKRALNSRKSNENFEKSCDALLGSEENPKDDEKQSMKIEPVPEPEPKVNKTATAQRTVTFQDKPPQIMNMAYLLDTPLKTDTNTIPITPRFIETASTTLDTPLTKFLNASTSFNLISSCKNLEVPTPSTAITPGAAFSALCEKETPRLNYPSRGTDYSSGSSYYKPDESEYLDRNLEAMLNVERKKRSIAKTTTTVTQESGFFAESVENSVQTVICVKTETKTLGGPSSQKGVQSCASLSTDKPVSNNDDEADMTSQATDLEEHPEEQPSLDVDSITFSSTSSSSTSSSSSSNDSSSSADISTDDKEWLEPSSPKKNTEIPPEADTRYPLRNLTPKKSDAASPAKPATAKPSHTTNSKAHQLTELEEKRLRMREKLKGDFSHVQKPQPRITRKKSESSTLKPSQSSANSESPPKSRGEAQIDMMKALNLSAKKQPAELTEERFNQRTCEDSRESTESGQIRNAATVLTTLKKGLTKSTKSPDLKRSKRTKGVTTLSALKATASRRTPVKIATKNRGLGLKANSGKPASGHTTKFVRSPPHREKAKRTPNRAIELRELDFTQKKSRTDGSKSAAAKEKSKSTRKLVDKDGQKIKNDTRKVSKASKNEGKNYDDSEKRDRNSEKPMKIKDAEQHQKFPDEKPPAPNPLQLPNAIFESGDEEEEDEDPYDACESFTIDENNQRCYKRIRHDSLTGSYPSLPSESQLNLSATVMNINFEGRALTWTVCDEIVLFEKNPVRPAETPVKTIPKKRHKNPQKPSIPKSPCDRRDGGAMVLSNSYAIVEGDSGVRLEEERPQHSSTPIVPKIRLKHRNYYNRYEPKSKTDASKPPNRSPVNHPLTSSPNSNPADATMKLKSEDIFAVLSHLHGSD